jgi:adenine-specific DNA-methyltransferase
MEMKQLTSHDPETQSADLLAGNIAQLQTLFPEAFTEGKIDFDVLRQLLGGAVDEREEKYGLNWYGKRRARQLALTPSTGTLRPCPADSIDWDTTQNLMIEGDNLEVLKLLQKGYAGKVKLIYIDPPYNTGKDFVYRDDFQDNIKNFLELTGQMEGGKKISSNTEASGRFHTDWLNMMYPRLKLARNLLREDGAILISIDDGEVDNLRKICTEVFGEENFVTTIIWQKKYSPSNDAKWLSDNHDYLVLVARDKEIWRPNLLPRTEEANARYSNPDNDPRGDWKPSGLDVKTYSVACDYEITAPSGRVVRPPAGACWRVGKSRFAEMVADNRIWFGKDGNNVPAIKRFLSEVKQGITPLTIWTHDEVGHNQEATQEVRALGITGFDSPKPVRLLIRALQISSGKNDIIVDFFAGSGTTAHAVMALNATDGGNRRYILVQLPEPLDPENIIQKIAADCCDQLGKPRSIAELTKERLRRAGIKIRGDNPQIQGDFGFRVFKLDSSNIRAWEPDRTDVNSLAQSLLDAAEHLKADRTEQDILYELLLKLGLDLTVPIEQKTIAGKTVHSIGAGVLLVCLAPQISAADAEPLALGIVSWHEEWAPAGETQVVFCDSAFTDDVAKTNLAAILQQHGLANVRSL